MLVALQIRPHEWNLPMTGAWLRIETGQIARLRSGEVGRVISIDETGVRVELPEETRLVAESEIATTESAHEGTSKGYAPRRVGITETDVGTGPEDLKG